MSKQIDVNKVIANTIIAVTQVANQGLDATQLVSIDCSGQARTDECNACIKVWADRALGKPDLDAIQETCRFVCSCEINNVDMSQVVSVDFRSLQSVTNKEEFFNSFLSNLYLEANQEDVSLPGLESEMKVLQEKVNAIYDSLIDENVQKSLQALSTAQVVRLKGPGVISGVNMKQMVTMVSSAIQTIAKLSTEIASLESTLISVTEQIVLAGLEQLIVSVIMIFAILIIMVVIFFAGQNLLAVAAVA